MAPAWAEPEGRDPLLNCLRDLTRCVARPHLDAQGMDTTNSGLILTLDVPVIDLDKAAWVEWGTILAVVLATAWILQKLAYIAWSDYNPSAKRKARAESQKKVHIS